MPNQKQIVAAENILRGVMTQPVMIAQAIREHVDTFKQKATWGKYEDGVVETARRIGTRIRVLAPEISMETWAHACGLESL